MSRSHVQFDVRLRTETGESTLCEKLFIDPPSGKKRRR